MQIALKLFGPILYSDLTRYELCHVMEMIRLTISLIYTSKERYITPQYKVLANFSHGPFYPCANLLPFLSFDLKQLSHCSSRLTKSLDKPLDKPSADSNREILSKYNYFPSNETYLLPFIFLNGYQTLE